MLRPEPEGGFSVFVPELPSVATQGETIKKATAMAKEVIEAYLEVMHEDGLPIPTVHRSHVEVNGSPVKGEGPGQALRRLKMLKPKPVSPGRSSN